MSDLERPQVRVDREDVDQLQGGEDVGGSKQALQSSVKSVREQQRLAFSLHLRDQCGVPGIPFLSRQTHRVNSQSRLKLDLKSLDFREEEERKKLWKFPSVFLVCIPPLVFA